MATMTEAVTGSKPGVRLYVWNGAAHRQQYESTRQIDANVARDGLRVEDYVQIQQLQERRPGREGCHHSQHSDLKGCLIKLVGH
jgi:hypothetical protein